MKEIIFRSRVTGATGAGCILDDLHTEGEEAVMSAVGDIQNIMLSYDDGEGSLEAVTFDVINSPITEPHGWVKELPADTKEFGYITSKGLIRRYCLLLKNAAGQYDSVEIYKNKKNRQNRLQCYITANMQKTLWMILCRMEKLFPAFVKKQLFWKLLKMETR